MKEPGLLDRLTLDGHRSPAKVLARWVIPYSLYNILHSRFAQTHEERQLQHKIEHLQDEWRSANQAQCVGKLVKDPEGCDITREQISAVLEFAARSLDAPTSTPPGSLADARSV